MLAQSDHGLQITVFTPLSPAECAERDRLDAEMDETEASALTYIRDLLAYKAKALWRGPFKSWDDYLASRRKAYSRKRFGQLTSQVAVTDALASQGVTVLPHIERQTRELAHLKDPAMQAAAWLNAQAASGEVQPSYSWVRSSVETLEQTLADGKVYVGEGQGAEPTAQSLKEGTVNTESERVDRMLDHIRANRRVKPAVVFEGKVLAKTPGWLSLEIPLDAHASFKTNDRFRFVLYEIKQTEMKAEAKA